MTPHLSPSPRLPTALILAASIAIVGIVLAAQYAGGLTPCELCLYERWPYYAAIVAAIAGLLGGSPRGMRAILGLCVLIFLAGSALAFYHVGVEQHWFPGPSACTGTISADSLDALKAQLMARQPVNCDEAAWTFHGLSLAALNLIASLLLLAFSALAFRRLGGKGGRR